jgi:hypothetical protein
MNKQRAYQSMIDACRAMMNNVVVNNNDRVCVVNDTLLHDASRAMRETNAHDNVTSFVYDNICEMIENVNNRFVHRIEYTTRIDDMICYCEYMRDECDACDA